MPIVNEAAVTFTSLVVGLLTTGVLVLLPSTWHGHGRSMQYWVASNLTLALDRLIALLPALGGPEWLSPSALTLLGHIAPSIVMLSAYLQAAALRLLLRPELRQPSWRWPVALSLLHGALFCALDSQRLAALVFTACLMSCMVLMLAMCWPQRHKLRGSMLMSVAVGYFLLTFAGVTWEHLLAAAHGAPMAKPSRSTGVLALDLVLAVVVNLAYLMMLIELLQQRIERLSSTDPLTGALNRRGFLQAANLQLLHAKRLGRSRSPASVLLLDMDHFKRINDTLGHPMGDAVLRGVVERAGKVLRQTDMLGRWGGEEFAVLLPGSNQPQAREVAERLRQAIADKPLAQGAPVVTVSIGAATLEELLAVEQLPELIAEADRRLYIAKRRRNCVVAEDPPDRLHEAVAGT